MIQKSYLKTKPVCKVKFTLEAENANSVEIFGLENNWETPIELKKKKDGTFSAEVNLAKETTHQFKYLINKASWENEPEADAEYANEYGGTNSVLTV